MTEEFFNPINPDKVAENPGLMAYAHSAGGAVIRPDDMGKVKGKSVLAMHQQSERQLNQIYVQMATLAQQAKALRERVEVSERIYKIYKSINVIYVLDDITQGNRIYNSRNLIDVLEKEYRRI